MSYTYSDFYTELKNSTHNKLGSVPSVRALINRAVRLTNDDLDMRFTKRTLGIPKAIYTGVYDLAAPSDIKGRAIIDIIPLRDRSIDEDWIHTTAEEFDRRKSVDECLFCLDESDQLKKLRINQFGNSTTTVLNSCDSYSGNGTWVNSSNVTSVATETSNYLVGAGAVRFSMSASPASLVNSTMAAVDLSAYKYEGEAFVSLYVPSAATAASGVTVTLRWGSDSANYYENDTTTAHDGNPLRAGWNILRFNWFLGDVTTVGSPVDTAIKYVKITITVASFQNDGWLIDNISFGLPEFRQLAYYSNYYWQSAAGVLLENSTAEDDVLLADTDEFQVYVNRGTLEADKVLRESSDLALAQTDYDKSMKRYGKLYPSERKPLITSYGETETEFGIN